MKGSAHTALAEPHFSQLRIYCMRSITPRVVDARISPRRNNRSFNSDAGSLSLSPCETRADPRRFRHRSRRRRTFILLLVSRGVRFIIAEAMICKISPPRPSVRPSVRLTFARLAGAGGAARRLSSVRIKLPFYYP